MCMAAHQVDFSNPESMKRENFGDRACIPIAAQHVDFGGISDLYRFRKLCKKNHEIRLRNQLNAIVVYGDRSHFLHNKKLSYVIETSDWVKVYIRIWIYFVLPRNNLPNKKRLSRYQTKSLLCSPKQRDTRSFCVFQEECHKSIFEYQRTKCLLPFP